MKPKLWRPITTNHQPKGALLCATWSDSRAQTAHVASFPRLLLPSFPTRLPRVLCPPVSLRGGKVHSRRTIIPYQGVPRNPCAVHIAIYIAWQPRRTPTEAAGRRGAGHLVHENCRICFRPVSFYESSDRVESTLRNPPSPSFPFPCSPPARAVPLAFASARRPSALRAGTGTNSRLRGKLRGGKQSRLVVWHGRVLAMMELAPRTMPFPASNFSPKPSLDTHCTL